VALSEIKMIPVLLLLLVWLLFVEEGVEEKKKEKKKEEEEAEEEEDEEEEEVEVVRFALCVELVCLLSSCSVAHRSGQRVFVCFPSVELDAESRIHGHCPTDSGFRGTLNIHLKRGDNLR
jgi:hypothetical protein